MHIDYDMVGTLGDAFKKKYDRELIETADELITGVGDGRISKDDGAAVSEVPIY